MATVVAIVEDDTDQRENYSDVLTADGYEVRAYADRPSAEAAFDQELPDLALLAPKRGFSVSGQQSLALYNNDFVLHASTWLAERVEREAPEGDQVSRAVQLCWQREPTEAEKAAFIIESQ